MEVSAAFLVLALAFAVVVVLVVGDVAFLVLAFAVVVVGDAAFLVLVFAVVAVVVLVVLVGDDVFFFLGLGPGLPRGLGLSAAMLV